MLGNLEIVVARGEYDIIKIINKDNNTIRGAIRETMEGDRTPEMCKP